MAIQIITYQEKYKQQIIDLILDIQNNEAKINLSLEEQPDLLDIPTCYEKDGGEFWLAVEGDTVVGTLALMNKGNGNAVLKKGFVRADYRKQGILGKLYATLQEFAMEQGLKTFVFDTPSVATNCHSFFEKRGYRRITKDELPFPYEYPDRDSYLYMIQQQSRVDGKSQLFGHIPSERSVEAIGKYARLHIQQGQAHRPVSENWSGEEIFDNLEILTSEAGLEELMNKYSKRDAIN